MASPCHLHSIVRGRNPALILAAYKGVASKGDAQYFNGNYNSSTLSQLRDSAHPQCEWTYNYWSQPVGVPSGMKFMPMVYGKEQFRTDGTLTSEAYNDLLRHGPVSQHILGFNEPDGGGSGSANVPVQDAVRYWHSVILQTSQASTDYHAICLVLMIYQTISTIVKVCSVTLQSVGPLDSQVCALQCWCDRCTTLQGRQVHSWEARP